MYCPECGTNASDDANFCLHCGNDLRVARGERAAAGDAPTEAIAPPDPADSPTEVVPAVRGEVAAAPAVELRRCKRCDAPNAPQRTSCGRCGADLDTGELSKSASPRVDPDRPSERMPERSLMEVETAEDVIGSGSNRAWVIAILIVLGLVIGAAVGLAAIRGLGPFGQEEEPAPAPTFDAGVYPGQPAPLEVATVSASSSLPPSGGNTYDADNTLDDDRATAWNSDGAANPSGVGERLVLRFESPIWVKEVVVANGYQKDDERFFGNARIREARLIVDGGVEFDVLIEDLQGLQAIKLEPPQLTRTVVLEVTAIYPGERFEDLAVSEIVVNGWLAVGVDVDRANELQRAS